MTQRGSIVYLEGVSVTFDGFQALREVNLYVDHGELRALIGPNGAGKTTLLDVICGQVKPDTGRVIFGDTTDLSALESYQIAALGIGRKFQTPSVFKHLTLLENLILSLPQRWNLWSTLFGAPTAAQLDKMASILETLGLLEKAHHQAGSLSHGEVQWLEIVVWVAAGGRGTLVGAILGAIGINAARSVLTARYPEWWPIILGGLFVGVVMLFPDGLAGLPRQLQRWVRRLRWRRLTPAPVTPSAISPSLTGQQ